jgi:hypothetical protein
MFTSNQPKSAALRRESIEPRPLTKQRNNTEKHERTDEDRRHTLSKRIANSPSILMFIMKNMAKKRRAVVRAVVRNEDKSKATQSHKIANENSRSSGIEHSSKENILSFEQSQRAANNLQPHRVSPISDKTSQFKQEIKSKRRRQRERSPSRKSASTKSIFSEANSEINVEAIECLLTVACNILYLFTLILAVWPVSIVLRFMWLAHSYLSMAWPSLARATARLNAWHIKANEIEEQLLDRITFLN